MLLVAGNTYADRLKHIRGSLRLKQWEMAEKLGIDRERYKNWEYPSGNPPPPDMIAKIEALAPGNEVRESRGVYGVEAQPLLAVPNVGYAGMGAASDAYADDEDETVDIPGHFVIPGKTVALIAYGESMLPLIQPRDRVIGRRMREARDGKVYVVRPAESRPIVKEAHWIANDHAWSLESWNPSYPPIDAKHAEVVAIVTGIISEDGRFAVGPDFSGLTRAGIEAELRSRLGR